MFYFKAGFLNISRKPPICGDQTGLWFGGHTGTKPSVTIVQREISWHQTEVSFIREPPPDGWGAAGGQSAINEPLCWWLKKQDDTSDLLSPSCEYVAVFSSNMNENVNMLVTSICKHVLKDNILLGFAWFSLKICFFFLDAYQSNYIGEPTSPIHSSSEHSSSTTVL